jgi:hypothetical protein
MSSTVAFAVDASEDISACRKLFSAGFFLSASPNICWRIEGFVDRCDDGGAGKSEALFIDGGGLRLFFVALFAKLLLLALWTLLDIEGKSEALFIDGGGAALR